MFHCVLEIYIDFMQAYAELDKLHVIVISSSAIGGSVLLFIIGIILGLLCGVKCMQKCGKNAISNQETCDPDIYHEYEEIDVEDKSISIKTSKNLAYEDIKITNL